MRYRTPTQLHASLYMKEYFAAKEEKGSFNLGKNAKVEVKSMSKTASAEAKKGKS